jgi:hypothetical protein
MAMPFMEALELHEEAGKWVSTAINAARSDPSRTGPQARRQDIDDTVLLYRDRARVRNLKAED